MFVGETSLDSSNLKTNFKMLHNMCRHCLLPRTGSKNNVYDYNLFLMYHLFHGLKMNLSYMILHHMMFVALGVNKKTTVTYDIVLTKNFKLFKVPLKDEVYLTSFLKFTIKKYELYEKGSYNK